MSTLDVAPENRKRTRRRIFAYVGWVMAFVAFVAYLGHGWELLSNIADLAMAVPK